jgi:hypothetical protein
MSPIVDTTKFRDAIRVAFSTAAKKDRVPKVAEGDGVEAVPADDRELMGEGVSKPGTVKHWAGWVYQKRDNGQWEKLCPSPKRGLKPKNKESP